jgi:pilus assembly protein FimV
MTAMKKTFKATLIAGAIAMLPFGTQAAGLGGINVFSGLGQPLRAEIELTATPQELQTLSARIASVDAFRQANVTYSSVMTGVQVSVESRGNRSVIRLVSDRPVNEPFLELLVELNWANGRMLREYTFLLDPIEAVRPAAAAVTAPVATPGARAGTPPASGVAQSGQYRVQRGDTLQAIANRHRVEGVTLDQMLMALLRQNPAAFADNNINRLRAGAILTIPDQASAGSIAPAQARREVLAQAADFEAYRSRLAGTVAARPAETEPTADRESVGEIAPRVEEPVRAEEPQDRVEVSGAPTTGDPTHLARLEALEEELVARERSLDEANSRLAELEQSVRDMQRLIELRNESLALLQQQLAAGGAELPEGEALPAPRDLLPPEPAEEPAAAQAAEPVEQPVAGPVAEPLAPAAAVEAPVAAAPSADVPAERPAAPPVVAPAPTAPEPVATPEPRPAPRPVPPEPMPQPTFLQSALQDPMMLAGGGGILALLLAYAGLKVRQRRQAEEAGEPASGLTEFPSEAQSVFGGKGGQSVDTGNSSVLHTDFSQSGLSAIDADEGVDPVAEADVYMAYGRDAQAEEILLDALKADPSRSAIYLKLLEIYAQRNSLRQFESVATDLYSRTEGQGADWVKAAEMGRKLDPDNPLYVLKSAVGEAESSGPVTEPGSSVQRSAGGAAATGAALGAAAVAAGTDALAPDRDKAIEAEDAAVTSQLGDLDFTTSQPVEPSASQLKDTWTMPGDLSRIGQAVEEGTEADVARAVEEAAGGNVLEQSDSAVDFSVLDFDLGADDSPQGEAHRAAESSATVEDAAEMEGTSAGGGDDLVLDLGIDDVSEPVTGTAPAGPDMLEPPVDASTESSVLAAVSEQFDPQSMNATVVGDEMDLALAEQGLDDDASFDQSGAGKEDRMVTVSSGDDIDLTATMVGRDEVGDDEDSSVMDLEKTGFDNSLLDFDFDIESATSDVGGEAPPLDLSNIDLDLELPDEGAARTAMPQESGVSAGDEVVPTAEALQEVDTKLDLARAYEEMGDKEGARELIDEVLREGSPEQREAANRLLERLG